LARPLYKRAPGELNYASGASQHDATCHPCPRHQDAKISKEQPNVIRQRLTVVAGASLVIALLGVFAYSLAHAQSQARGDVEHRFRDVASVSAALTGGLLDVANTSGQQTAAKTLGGATIDPRILEAQAAPQMLAYLEVLDAQGKVLAETPGAPPVSPSDPQFQLAVRTGQGKFTDLVRSPGIGLALQYVLPFKTPHGTRVEISGSHAELLASFLTSFLKKVPNFANATSVIIDSKNVILGGPQFLTRIGQPLGNASLLHALAHTNDGRFGGSYFAAAPIANTTWTVAIYTTQSRLYSSINGSRRTIPWLLFGAFALAALMGLYLLRRAAQQTSEIERKVLNERHAVEINDNIIQGLVLAHYRLAEGEQATSAEQLANTLREAQRLVSDLLGEGDVEPGSLRRPGAASVSGPPERSPSETDRS
jgi:hypothetical protein